MSLDEIARVTGGAVHGDCSVRVTGAAYADSREPVRDGLFVALTGDRADGHDHAGGAHAVLGSRPTGRPTVVVPDPVVALGRLARHVVDATGPTVVSITGSSGKTSTKDLLAHLLPDALATEGNRNNEIGLPLTVLRAGPLTRTLVLEAGSRGVGHLSYLADVAPPDVAVVLGVGSAHVGEFGSPDLVGIGKGELVEALRPEGVAVLNADDRRVLRMAVRTTAQVLTFGVAGEVSWRDVTLDRHARATFVLRALGRERRVRLRSAGVHQVSNAAAAVAAALALGRDLDELTGRLETAEPVAPGRFRPARRADGLLVIDDSYNANPESVHAALGTLAALDRPGRRLAVFGELRELGPHAAPAHRRLGETARRLGIEVLAVAAPGIPHATHVPDRAAALDHLRGTLTPADTVLVKGSRAAALDLLAADLLAS